MHVPDLNEALAFYKGKLGHELLWRRGDESAGLRMEASDTELVLAAGGNGSEVDILVASVDTAAEQFRSAGGEIVESPFDIPIGRCAVIRDPFGNKLVILDISKGYLKTDRQGNVVEL